MKIFETEIECMMDGGDTLTAKVDQRDYAAFEGNELFETVGPASITKVRWLAWNALRRSGQLQKSHTWTEFNERLCVQASVASVPEDEEGEESEDPSRT